MIIDDPPSTTWKIRRWILDNIVSSKSFHVWIIFTIITNCILIGIDSLNSLTGRIELKPYHYVYLSLFTFELLLKMIGFGFYEQMDIKFIAFFKHPLHCIDFCLLFLSWILTINYDIGLTPFRVVLLVFYIPLTELHIFILAIWNSIKKLSFILLFFSLFYWVFGVFGIQYMSGVLHNRCYLEEYKYSNDNNDNEIIRPNPNTDLNNISSNIVNNITSNIFCVYNSHDWNEYLNESKISNNYDKNDCWQKSVFYNLSLNYTVCLPLSSNPQSGLFSFDNIGDSISTLFIVSSGHWAIVMSYVEEAYGHNYISAYFFVFSFMFSFLLLPLLLAFFTETFKEDALIEYEEYVRKPYGTPFSSITGNVRFGQDNTRSHSHAHTHAHSDDGSSQLNEIEYMSNKRGGKGKGKKISSSSIDDTPRPSNLKNIRTRTLTDDKSKKSQYIAVTPEMVGMKNATPNLTTPNRSLPNNNNNNNNNGNNNNNKNNSNNSKDAIEMGTMDLTRIVEETEYDSNNPRFSQYGAATTGTNSSTNKSARNSRLSADIGADIFEIVNNNDDDDDNQGSIDMPLNFDRNDSENSTLRANVITPLTIDDTPMYSNANSNVITPKYSNASPIGTGAGGGAGAGGAGGSGQQGRRQHRQHKQSRHGTGSFGQGVGARGTLQLSKKSSISLHRGARGSRGTILNNKNKKSIKDSKRRKLSHTRQTKTNITQTTTIDQMQSSLIDATTDKQDERIVIEAIRIGKERRDINDVEKLSIWRKKLIEFLRSNNFQMFVLISILLNIIALSLRWPKMPQILIIILNYVDAAFLLLFIFELIIKHIGLGIFGYWKSVWNVIDGVIIILSCIAWISLTIFETSLNWENDGAGLSALISLRLLRIIKTLRSIKWFENFNRVMSIVSDVFTHILWMTLLLLVFFFMFSLLGTSLFSEKITTNQHTLWSFNNIFLALLTVLQIGTGQDWVNVMSDVVDQTSRWALVYFSITVIFGVWGISRVFIAVTLSTINKHDTEDEEILTYILPSSEEIISNQHKNRINDDELKKILFEQVKERRQELVHRRMWDYLFRHRDTTVMFGTSLYIFSMRSKIRHYLHKIITNKFYQYFIDFLILLNAITFGLYDATELSKNSSKNENSNGKTQYFIYFYLDVIFVVIFTLEIILKIIVFGFHSKAMVGGRVWDRVVDSDHRRNWRARCIHVWNIMCEYDEYAVNSNQYNDDLGIYDLSKSNDGWAIVHCVIPSSGLEIRILFYFSDFRNIYICRQYFSKSISTPESQLNPLGNVSNNANITNISNTRGVRSANSSIVGNIGVSTMNNTIGNNIFSLNSQYMTSMDIDTTRQSYDGSIGLNDSVLSLNSSHRPHYSSNETTTTKLSIRAWVKWEIPKSVKLSYMDSKVRDMFVDSGLRQMMMSVALEMKNTNAFCQDYWNIMDGIVVIMSLISLIISLPFFSAFRALRIFRVIIRHGPMRSIVESLGKGSWTILSGITFAFIVFFILAVVGLNLFYKQFDVCSCSSTIALTFVTEDSCINGNINGGLKWNEEGYCECSTSAKIYDFNEIECTGRAFAYASPSFRFDTVFESLFAVFLIARGAQWDYFLFNTFELEESKNWDYRDFTTVATAGAYFLIVVLIGQYFVTSMIIAIVISSYNRWHHEENKLLLNISVHKSLQRISQFLTTFRKKHCRLPPLPDNIFGQYCLKLVDSKYFRIFIFGCIGLNMIVLGLQKYPTNDNPESFYSQILHYCGMIFLIIYTLEIILKLIAYGFKYFLSLHSYKFAIVVVILQWGAFIYYFIERNTTGTVKSYVVPFNVLMIFRFVLIVPKFQTFAEILFLCAKSILYTIIFLFLISFVFAIIGVALFDNNNFNNTTNSIDYYDDFLTDLTSPGNFFRNLGSAMYVLYIYGTAAGDSWTPILIEMSSEFNSWSVAIYFVLFYIIVVIVVGSVFSAVLVEYYHDWHEAENIFKQLSMLKDLETSWRDQVTKLRKEFFEDQNALRVANKNLKEKVLELHNDHLKKSNSLHGHKGRGGSITAVDINTLTPKHLKVGNRSINTIRQRSDKAHGFSTYVPRTPMSKTELLTNVGELVSLSSLWKEFIAANNLYDTTIPATQFLYILAKMERPIGFRDLLIHTPQFERQNSNSSSVSINTSRTHSRSTSMSGYNNNNNNITNNFAFVSTRLAQNSAYSINPDYIIDGYDIADYYFDLDRIRMYRTLPSDVYRRLLIFFDGLHIPIKKNPIMNSYGTSSNSARASNIGSMYNSNGIHSANTSLNPYSPHPGIGTTSGNSSANIIGSSGNISVKGTSTSPMPAMKESIEEDDDNDNDNDNDEDSSAANIPMLKTTERNGAGAAGAGIGAGQQTVGVSLLTPKTRPTSSKSPPRTPHIRWHKDSNDGGPVHKESMQSQMTSLTGMTAMTAMTGVTTMTGATRLRKQTEMYEEWDYVVNFEDIVSAFTWRILDVDVLVNLEKDEEWIVDWFVRHWDCT